MNIDTLLEDLHRDRAGSIAEQLRSVEADIAARQVISVTTVVSLRSQLEDLTAKIQRLLPEHPGAADPNRMERARLEADHRDVERRVHEELVARERDLKDLRREHRELTREQTVERQRYERHQPLYRTMPALR